MAYKVELPIGPIGAGITVPLNNPSDWVKVRSVRVRIDTTAKVGDRQFVFGFSDPWGLIFTAAAQLTPPSQQTVLLAGGGMSAGAEQDAATGWYTLALPTKLLLPPGASLLLRDGNAVDPTDNLVLGVVVLS